jgi:hypothetical protein
MKDWYDMIFAKLHLQKNLDLAFTQASMENDHKLKQIVTVASFSKEGTGTSSTTAVEKREVLKPMAWEANGVTLNAGADLTILMPLCFPDDDSNDAVVSGMMSWTLFADTTPSITLTLSGDCIVVENGSASGSGIELMSTPADWKTNNRIAMHGSHAVKCKRPNDVQNNHQVSSSSSSSVLRLKLHNRYDSIPSI